MDWLMRSLWEIPKVLTPYFRRSLGRELPVGSVCPFSSTLSFGFRWKALWNTQPASRHNAGPRFFEIPRRNDLGRKGQRLRGSGESRRPSRLGFARHLAAKLRPLLDSRREGPREPSQRVSKRETSQTRALSNRSPRPHSLLHVWAPAQQAELGSGRYSQLRAFWSFPSISKASGSPRVQALSLEATEVWS